MLTPRVAGRADGRPGHRAPPAAPAFGARPRCPGRPMPTTRTIRCRRRGIRSPGRRRLQAGLSGPGTAGPAGAGCCRAGHSARRDHGAGWADEADPAPRAVGSGVACSRPRVVLRRADWRGIGERADARWPRHRTRPHDDLRADARHVGAQRRTATSGSPTSSSARCAAIELKNWVATLTLDLQPERQAAGERHRPRSARRACWARSTWNWPRRRTRRRSRCETATRSR